MKKLLLVAALGVAGLMSAKGNANSIENKSNTGTAFQINKNELKIAPLKKSTIRVVIVTTCGWVVSFDSPLTGNEDDSVFEGLGDLFNYQYCGTMPGAGGWDIDRN